jgi:hypothetical protein
MITMEYAFSAESSIEEYVASGPSNETARMRAFARPIFKRRRSANQGTGSGCASSRLFCRWHREKQSKSTGTEQSRVIEQHRPCAVAKGDMQHRMCLRHRVTLCFITLTYYGRKDRRVSSSRHRSRWSTGALNAANAATGTRNTLGLYATVVPNRIECNEQRLTISCVSAISITTKLCHNHLQTNGRFFFDHLPNKVIYLHNEDLWLKSKNGTYPDGTAAVTSVTVLRPPNDTCNACVFLSPVPVIIFPATFLLQMRTY